jgi:hypothetical protein
VQDQEVSRSLELEPGLKYLIVDSPVTSGDRILVQIGLNGAAPEGGTVVTMESDKPAVRLPAIIKIPTTTVTLKAWTYDPGDWSLTGPQTVHGGGFIDPATQGARPAAPA